MSSPSPKIDDDILTLLNLSLVLQVATKRKSTSKATVASPSPIASALKRSPGSKTASPIAVKREVDPSKLASSTSVRSSPRKKVESDECITLN